MADEYKKKLEAFIVNVPGFPGELRSGEPKPRPAGGYDEAFKKQLDDPNFNLPTVKEFEDYTGTTHLSLIKNWNSGGIKTTCNEFVGKAGYVMGANIFLGQFELEALLNKTGKGYAWVSASSKEFPNYGDIFRPVKYHMGISLGISDGVWLTVESGQGGPASGCDKIKRKQQKFERSELLGWCDMKLYLSSKPPLPDWMVGMWIIYDGLQTYSYQFTKYSEAFYYPWNMFGNPLNQQPMATGTVAQLPGDSFTVNWNHKSGIEKFTYDRWESFPGILERMSGTNASNGVLKGVRI